MFGILLNVRKATDFDDNIQEHNEVGDDHYAERNGDSIKYHVLVSYITGLTIVPKPVPKIKVIVIG